MPTAAYASARIDDVLKQQNTHLAGFTGSDMLTNNPRKMLQTIEGPSTNQKNNTGGMLYDTLACCCRPTGLLLRKRTLMDTDATMQTLAAAKCIHFFDPVGFGGGKNMSRFNIQTTRALKIRQFIDTNVYCARDLVCDVQVVVYRVQQRRLL
jgi:hypothetical protein